MKKGISFLPYTLCVAVVVLLAFSSCSKSDGKDGVDGINGTNGTNGTPGAQGPAGTANVIYSNWIDTTTWKPDTVMVGNVVTDTLGFYANISAPKLDLTILNTGEIKVYVNVNTTADPTVFPLPFNNGSLFIDPVFFLNTIQLYSNGKLTNVPFRYVLIPGGTAARKTNSINWNNYAEVQKYLGLKD